MSQLSLSGIRVLITGVGIKPVAHVFHDLITGRPTHLAINHGEQEYKANIGAATALACARAGAVIHLLARTESNLTIVRDWILGQIPETAIELAAVDLNDRPALDQWVGSLPSDLSLYWVQSVGLGAGTVHLKNDNPYLPITDINADVVEAELSVMRNTLTLLQLLLPRLRPRLYNRAKVCMVSSMSAIRSYPNGGVHCAAKGAISRFANAAMIELAPERIYITDVRPGAVDTGLYDPEEVRRAVIDIAASYGYDWSAREDHWSARLGGLRLVSPSAVAEAIVMALASTGHITSINLVAQGQWPHEGS